MAEGGGYLFSMSLEKLDAELTCPVCTEHFKEPKVLPCLHYYCKTCIADLIKRANGQPFNCPECRRKAQAGGNNPESFPAAFFVNRMEDVFSVMKKAEPKDEGVKCESCEKLPAIDFCHNCSEYICTKCSEAHKNMRKLSSHIVVSIVSLRSTISKSPPEKTLVVHEARCKKHTDEPLKLYCHDCHKLVCRDCIVIDHKDHNYAFVVDVAPKSKAKIQENTKAVKKLSQSLMLVRSSLDQSKKKLSNCTTSTMVAIDAAIDKLAAKLAQKRVSLKEKATRMMAEAEDKLAVQDKNAELAVGEVESLVEFMNRTLERATDQEVLSLEKQMSDQVDRVSRLYSNPADRFPVPTLPELEVYSGEGVKKAIETDISVVNKTVKKVATFHSPALSGTNVFGGQLYSVRPASASASYMGPELPEYWAPMKKGVSLHLVDLKTTSKEYVFVLGEFNKTMKQGSKYSTIFQIQRIQNPSLYKQLVAKKIQLDLQNPPDVQNERWLFHGTEQASIDSINTNNFSTNFRGQNATKYGQGIYFARDAAFSNGYALPDGQGCKYMYLVRVLTGQYTRGHSSMIIPPAKDLSDRLVLFESVVNDTASPTVFVVFYDSDAYPEYLITYR